MLEITKNDHHANLLATEFQQAVMQVIAGF